VDSAGNVVASVNLAVAGTYPQPDIVAGPLAAGPFTVKAIALGTVGAVYSASVSVVPSQFPQCVVELQDGNQALGEVSVSADNSDFHSIPGPGLHVSQQIKLHMVSGIVTGVVYARFYK
jgi:hypothetical protein